MLNGLTTMTCKYLTPPPPHQDDIRMDAVTREELTVAASAKTGLGMDDFVTVLEARVTIGSAASYW